MKKDGASLIVLVPDNLERGQLVSLLDALSCQDPVVEDLAIVETPFNELQVRFFRRKDREIASRQFASAVTRRDRQYFESVVAEYARFIEGTEFGMLGSPALGAEVVLKQGPMVDATIAGLIVKDWSP